MKGSSKLFFKNVIMLVDCFNSILVHSDEFSRRFFRFSAGWFLPSVIQTLELILPSKFSIFYYLLRSQLILGLTTFLLIVLPVISSHVLLLCWFVLPVIDFTSTCLFCHSFTFDLCHVHVSSIIGSASLLTHFFKSLISMFIESWVSNEHISTGDGKFGTDLNM